MPSEVDYRKKTFGNVVQALRSGLESGRINSQRAREISRFVLEILPESINRKDFFAKSSIFKDRYPELAHVSLVVNKDYEDVIQETIVPQVSMLISEGRFAEASELMKKATNKELDL